jgi:hypothetical protein
LLKARAWTVLREHADLAIPDDLHEQRIRRARELAPLAIQLAEGGDLVREFPTSFENDNRPTLLDHAKQFLSRSSAIPSQDSNHRFLASEVLHQIELNVAFIAKRVAVHQYEVRVIGIK